MKKQNLIDRFNRWLQESITVKLFSIGFLLLLLLIPLSWVNDLIQERQQRSDDVQLDITSKWSGAQTISGPLLVLPYKRIELIEKLNGEKEKIEVDERLFVSPNELQVTGSVDPQVLHRGIFEAAVYNSQLKVVCSFNDPDLKSLDIDPDMVRWRDAYLVIGLSDLRGVNENPIFKNGSRVMEVEPSSEVGYVYGEQNRTGLVGKLHLSGYQDLETLSFSLKLKGSRSLNFTPIAKTTQVNLQGPWKDPSFHGEFLPESREITTDGFKASWSVLHFNRPFIPQWKQLDKNLGGSDFGVSLLIPVEQYQKSMRTYKYGVLVILLTFISLFLVEISLQVRIHPLQYTLIGAALIVYYALLLSFSEQLGYNAAYAIASMATVLLVSFYSRTFLPTKVATFLFSGILIASYGFIFVIIIQQDFSLLIGSVGLFIVIGAIMFLTRKINWYRDSIDQVADDATKTAGI